jgi:hypothetical protein
VNNAALSSAVINSAWWKKLRRKDDYFRLYKIVDSEWFAVAGV